MAAPAAAAATAVIRGTRRDATYMHGHQRWSSFDWKFDIFASQQFHRPNFFRCLSFSLWMGWVSLCLRFFSFDFLAFMLGRLVGALGGGWLDGRLFWRYSRFIYSSSSSPATATTAAAAAGLLLSVFEIIC
ncbi:hypothetical protein IWX91DRAFT_350663 [Phyllosticta citricarpa]